LIFGDGIGGICKFFYIFFKGIRKTAFGAFCPHPKCASEENKPDLNLSTISKVFLKGYCGQKYFRFFLLHP